MTYQRFSGAFVVSTPAVSVITCFLCRSGKQADGFGEHEVEYRDVQADDQAHRHHEDREVAHLLPRRPGNLLQFVPRLVDEASDAFHDCSRSRCWNGLWDERWQGR